MYKKILACHGVSNFLKQQTQGCYFNFNNRQYNSYAPRRLYNKAFSYCVTFIQFYLMMISFHSFEFSFFFA